MTRRTDPALWEAVKAEILAGSKGGKPGEWSARKAQMAVRAYRAAGGGYRGPRDPDNALARWTAQDWRTASGRPSLETGERYLPAVALAALTPEEYAATTRAKRAGMKAGRQFVAQPAAAKAAGALARRPELVAGRLVRLFAGARRGTLGDRSVIRRGVLAALAEPDAALDALLDAAEARLGAAEVEARLRAYARGA